MVSFLRLIKKKTTILFDFSAIAFFKNTSLRITYQCIDIYIYIYIYLSIYL